MMEELELLEARYQGSVARSRDALLTDFMIRYGDRAGELLNEALKVYELDTDSKIKVRRMITDELAYRIDKLIKHRLSLMNIDIEPILATWYYIGSNERMDRLVNLLNMAGWSISIDDYVKVGLLMRISRSTVIIPEYLANYLSSMEPPRQLDSSSIVFSNAENAIFMVTLETVVRNLRPVSGFVRAFYGKGIKEALNEGILGQIARLHNGEVLINPLVNPRELRVALARIKNSRARVIKHSLSIYGRYSFSRELYCGINYMFTYSSRGLVVYICPWTPLYKSIIGKYSNVRGMVVIETRFRDSIVDFLSSEKSKRPELSRIMFATLDQATKRIHAIYQHESRSMMDDVLDVLYESGYNVLEVTY